MKTNKAQHITYTLQPETAATVRSGMDIVACAHRQGVTYGEPLIMMLDSLLNYAKAYRIRFDSPLAEDYVLGESFLASLKGVRGLLDGDGAVAMVRGLTTDSKDNGACESLFWLALEAAGYTEETANL